jgi:hypothetical protein
LWKVISDTRKQLLEEQKLHEERIKKEWERIFPRAETAMESQANNLLVENL